MSNKGESHFYVGLILFAAMSTSADTQAACPAPWSASGSATQYSPNGVGQCSPESTNGLSVALAPADYGDSSHCGECLEVTGPSGSVVVVVADKCTTCQAGELDLSDAAFEAITSQNGGSVDVTWRRVACPVVGNVAFNFQGSNPYYLNLHASNHRYGISSMELLNPVTQQYQSMARNNTNSFTVSPSSAPNPSPTIRITATSGETLEHHFSLIDNANTIAGTAQFEDCSLIFRNGFESMPTQ